MQFDPSKITAKSYRAEVVAKLKAGREHLGWLMDAYNWGSQHLRQIKRLSPDYEHGWFRNEIMATFNVDPQDYLRACEKLGGGRAAHLVLRGRHVIEQVGVPAALAACRVLTDEEARTVAQDLAANAGHDDLKAAVEKVVAARPDNGAPHGSRMSWKARCIELERENAALKKEVEILRALLEERRVKAAS